MSWYVDDNKLSHKDSKMVDAILSEMTKKIGNLTTTRGDNHIFLGMKLSVDRKFKTFSVD